MPARESRASRGGNYFSTILLIALVSVLAYGAVLFKMGVGFPLDAAGGYPMREGVVVEYASLRSTLVPRDLVVAINGQTISDIYQHQERWRAFLADSGASGATYTVIRDGEPRLVEVQWMHIPLHIVLMRLSFLFFTALSFLVVAALIALSAEENSTTLWIAALFGIQALNLLNNGITRLGVNFTLAFIRLFKVVDLLTFAMEMSLAMHVLLIYPERKWVVRRFPLLPYAVHALNLWLAWQAILSWGGKAATAARASFYNRLVLLIGGVELVVGLGHLVHTYLTSHKPGVRNQIRWVVWGMVVGTLPWLIAYNFPVTLDKPPLLSFPVAALPMTLVPVTFFLSITRRALTAVDRLIHRTLIYATMGLGLGAVYMAAAGLAQWFAGRLRMSGTALPTVLAVLAVAVMVSPMRHWAQNLVDRLFFRHWIDLRAVLREAGSRLSMTLAMDEMERVLTEELPSRLGAVRAALWLCDDEACHRGTAGESASLAWDHPLVQLLSHRSEPLLVSRDEDVRGILQALGEPEWEALFPMLCAGKLVGVYLLGPRRTGDLYSRDELEMLTLLTQQAAVALENARLYRKVAAYTQDLKELVKARTQELETANRRLVGERDRLNAILQSMADGLLVIDRDDRIVLVNPAFTAMIGRTAESLIGRYVGDVMDCSQLLQVLAEARRQMGTVLSTDCHVGERVIRASATALPLQGGEGGGAIAVLRDITHEVEVDRMKTEFISTVSHELRTPLTSVLGFTKLIRKSLARSVAPHVPPGNTAAQQAVRRIQENLDIIAAEGERLTRLINDVLDIAKIDAGKMEWHDRRLDMGALVQRSVEGMMALAEEKGLWLRTQIEPGLPPLVADPDRIQQVLFNLLSNAIKFTDQGGIAVSVRLVQPVDVGVELPLPEGSPGAICVSVSDTGPGIPPEELPNLFQRFKQVRENLLTNKPPGTGLGLAISREIVTHYGGVIWAESEPGKGATFTFLLPVPAPQEVMAAQEAKRHPAPSTSAVLTSPQKVLSELQRRMPTDAVEGDEGAVVLVVDDEAHVRALLRQVLTEAGYRVLEAANGVEALSMARKHHPSVILLDVMMPDISGFDVTQILKSDPATAEIPILILSIVEDRQHGLELGADAYLTKPVDMNLLLQTVSALASQSSSRRPRAMVAGQDRSVLERVTAMLRGMGFEVAEVYDPRGAIATAERVKPDVVILDEFFSKLNDAEIIKALRFQQTQSGEEHPPHTIIVLMGENGVPPSSGAASESSDSDEEASGGNH